MKTKRDICPCGDVFIVADTEEWKIPLCNACHEDMGCPVNEPRCMPKLAEQVTTLTRERDEALRTGRCMLPLVDECRAIKERDSLRTQLQSQAAQLAGMREALETLVGIVKQMEGFKSMSADGTIMKALSTPATEWEKRVQGLVGALKTLRVAVNDKQPDPGAVAFIDRALAAWEGKP